MKVGAMLSIAGLVIIFHWIYLSIRRNRRRPWFLAAEKFSEAFIDEIQDLSQGKGDAFEFLKSSFSKHEKAYLKFRTYLKGKTLQQFDEAWKDYFCNDKGNPQPLLEQYFAAGDMELAKEKRKIALKRIAKLLSFAKNS